MRARYADGDDASASASARTPWSSRWPPTTATCCSISWRMDIPVLGVEPTANIAEAARAKGVPTEVAFFGVETAQRLAPRGRKADLMAANNVLAHVPDIARLRRRLRRAAEAGGRRDLRVPAPAESDREGAVRHHLSRALFLSVAALRRTHDGGRGPAGVRRRGAADPWRVAAPVRLSRIGAPSRDCATGRDAPPRA